MARQTIQIFYEETPNGTYSVRAKLPKGESVQLVLEVLAEFIEQTMVIIQDAKIPKNKRSDLLVDDLPQLQKSK